MSEELSLDGKLPLYMQVADYLKEKIESGEFQPGERLPSERKLSEILEVSRVTVRKAISELINDGLVYTLPTKGTVVSDINVSPTQINRSPVVYFIIQRYLDASKQESNLDGFYLDVFEGVSDELSREGYKCVYVAPFGSKEEIINFLRVDVKDSFGVVLAGVREEEVTRLFKLSDTPLVLVNCVSPDGTIDHVITNNVKGIFDLVKYLVDLGHTRIGYIGWIEGSFDSRHRLDAFKDSMKKLGIKVYDNLISEISYEKDRDVYKIAEEYLTMDNPPTAIVAALDMVASSVMKVANQLGLNIPDDLSITGFGDNAYSKDSIPSLTTVYVNPRQLGTYAGKLLIERRKNKNNEIVKQVAIDTHLVIRESCSKPKASRN